MALLAGIAFIGAAATAEAAATTPPLVLDNAALDTVTAGNYAVFVQVFGQAAGVGDPVGSGEVAFFLDAQGNESRGSALGLVGALGLGQGAGADAASQTGSAAAGDVAYTRDFRKAFGGGGFALDFSASVGWAASFGDLQVPLNGPLQVPLQN